MAAMTATPGFVTGGVDTHLDVHVASALDHLGVVLGTASFPTTSAGYARLLSWREEHGPVEASKVPAATVLGWLSTCGRTVSR